MLNNKIINHIAKKASRRNNKNDEKILKWLSLDGHKDLVWEPSYIKHDMPSINGGSLYSSIYRLASQSKIGFASRTYHDFSKTEEIAGKPPRTRTLIWDIDHHVDLSVRSEWQVPISSKQVNVSGPISHESASGTLSVSGSTVSVDGSVLSRASSLFSAAKTPQEIVEAASVDDLQSLIDLAKKRQIQIGIDRRYACLNKAHRDTITDIFVGIGITDPVYFAHSDDNISLLTYTAVKDMPIDIVIDEGNGPRRVSAKHITLFGKALLAYTDSMFSAGSQS
jgi:hypothetical protein